MTFYGTPENVHVDSGKYEGGSIFSLYVPKHSIPNVCLELVLDNIYFSLKGVHL